MAIAGMTPGSSPLGSLDRRASLLREQAVDDASRSVSAGGTASANAANSRARAADPADVVTLSAAASTLAERSQQSALAANIAELAPSATSAEAASTSSSTLADRRARLAELIAHPLKVDPSMVRAPRDWEGHKPDTATATWFKKRHEFITQLNATLDGSIQSRVAWQNAVREFEPMPVTAGRKQVKADASS